MSIYERPTKSLMADWAKGALKPGQAFSKSDATRWFAEHYPKIKRNTVMMHVEGMSINNRIRRHHPSIKPNSGHDLFYKMGPDQFRLWNPDTDGMLHMCCIHFGAAKFLRLARIGKAAFIQRCFDSAIDARARRH